MSGHTGTADRLAEALQAADAQDRRLDGYKLDVIRRYAAALAPVVDGIVADELDALAAKLMRLWDCPVPAIDTAFDAAVIARAEAAALRGQGGES